MNTMFQTVRLVGSRHIQLQLLFTGGSGQCKAVCMHTDGKHIPITYEANCLEIYSKDTVEIYFFSVSRMQRVIFMNPRCRM